MNTSDRAGIGPESRPLLRADLLRIARQFGVPPEVVEKDYLLSYVLAGLSDIPELDGLRFKGGTALKKIYFGDYRFSEDLDFSAIELPQGAHLDILIGKAMKAAGERLEKRGRFRIEFDRPPEREPHPTGQDAFRVRVAFPWQASPMVRVKIEITHDEPILLPAPKLPVIHGYDELLDERLDNLCMATYALEEIVAEKLRALRQTHLRLEDRGWSRPRARDYYDLWRLLNERSDQVDPATVRSILPAKLARRGVSYQRAEDFFTPALVAEARRHWGSNLGTFVANLPDFEVVLQTLKPLIQRLLVDKQP